MNKGNYGFPLPPNAPTRVSPPKWASFIEFITPGTYQFEVPQNVYRLRAIVIGAGGSGAAVRTDLQSAALLATGGAAGAYAEVLIDVIPGQKLPTITVGAGGAGVSSSTNAAVNGNPGGTSSIGALVTCTGGAGGVGSYSTAASTTLVGPVSGGTYTTSCQIAKASNGGKGGIAADDSKAGAAYGCGIASGGGSCLGGSSGTARNIRVTPSSGGTYQTAASGGASFANSGSALLNSTGNTTNHSVTGGASVFVSKAITTTAGQNAASGGAGTLSSSGTTTQDGGFGYGLAMNSASASAIDNLIDDRFYDRVSNRRLYSGGTAGSTSANTADAGPYGGASGGCYRATAPASSGAAGLGAASGGCISTSSASASATSGSAGMFAGSGGAVSWSTSVSTTSNAISGPAGIGSGSGGAVAGWASASGTATSSDGGNGFIMLQWTEGY